MDLVSSMAVAQRGNKLRRDDSCFVERCSSLGVLHFFDPVGEAATGAEFHDDEAHGTECPFWHLTIEEIDESDHVCVILKLSC